MLLFDSLSLVFSVSSYRCNLLRAEIYTGSFLHILLTVAASHTFCHIIRVCIYATKAYQHVIHGSCGRMTASTIQFLPNPQAIQAIYHYNPSRYLPQSWPIDISPYPFKPYNASYRSIIRIDAHLAQHTHQQQTRGCEQAGALEQGLAARAESISFNQDGHKAILSQSKRRVSNFTAPIEHPNHNHQPNYSPI